MFIGWMAIGHLVGDHHGHTVLIRDALQLAQISIQGLDHSSSDDRYEKCY